MLFFFFKQKTAYEMRISDWSSDVCSSDLLAVFPQHREFAPDHLQPFVLGKQALHVGNARPAIGAGVIKELDEDDIAVSGACPCAFERSFDRLAVGGDHIAHLAVLKALDRLGYDRSEERRVGNECVSTCRCRWRPYH